MVPDNLEKPRVTEIQVRMDCNGCVQKIKRALNGINGIYDLYIDFPKQKLTIVGWADPEKIVKAIKKTRKIATICSHSEPTSTEPPPPAAAVPTPPPPETTSDPPAPEAQNPPPPPEAPPQEAAAPPPAEPAKEPVPPPQAPQAVPPEPDQVPPSTQSPHESKPTKPAPRDVEEIHIIHHHPHNYGVYNDHWSSSSTSTIHPSSSRGIFRHEAAPPFYHVTHSYNTHRPSPYVTEYEYRRSPPRTVRYGRTEQYYVDDYHVRGNYGNGDGNNITSIFSDENPNACRIA